MKEAFPTAEQILEQLREHRVPQAVIAERLGLPASAVSNLFKGKRHLKLSEANVLMGLFPTYQFVPREVPLIGIAGAGNWVEAIENSSQTVYLTPDIAPGARFAVEVLGRSMNLVLPEGSFAVIDPSDHSLFSKRMYLLLNRDGEATIKRYRSDPARFEPVSDDPTFQAFEIGSMDFRVIGRVVAAVTKF